MLPAVIDENIQETKEQKRKRLASELRFLTSQFNSKLLELMDTGVAVEIVHGTSITLADEENLMGLIDVTYQAPTKHY